MRLNKFRILWIGLREVGKVGWMELNEVKRVWTNRGENWRGWDGHNKAYKMSAKLN